MRMQMQRQEQPLKEQREMLQAFKDTEADLVNRLVIADTFSRQTNDYQNWEIANFHVGGHGLDSAAEVKGSWMPATMSPTSQGFQLRYFILRSHALLHLKSIACEIKLSLRLVGDSTLWVLTRGSGVKDPDAMVCKVQKDQDSQRVYLVFGGHVGPNYEFKFFKKQEMPELHEDFLVTQDSVDMKLTLIDNGDDRVFVTAATSSKRVVNMTCNKFIPCFREHPLMLAGSGESVLLKNVSVRQIDRVESLPRSNEHYECCLLL